MYNVYINLFVVSVNLQSRKKYILSKNSNEIEIPRILCKSDFKPKIKPYLSEFIRNIVPMNILGIIPQIITLHSQMLSNTYNRTKLYDSVPEDIECVYGCLVDNIDIVDKNYHWIEFSYEIPNDYSANIFEVCQYLQ
jgi:hypothetical protein